MVGSKTQIKLLILGAIFLLSVFAVYAGSKGSATPVPRGSLVLHMEKIEGYTNLHNAEMTKDALDMLNMDDYIFTNYADQNGQVNLYISHYNSADQAYDAHSPMICYPSHGWEIVTPPQKGTLNIGPQTIHYQEIVTSLADTKELVLYWYQARLFTSTQVYKNKVLMGYNKYVYDDESHGFLRVAVPFGTDGYSETKGRAVRFISAFYPRYVEYVIIQ